MLRLDDGPHAETGEETVDDTQGNQRGTARDRVLNAARTLFAQHGVSGASLQMIADHLGVTKAAVYHQFHTKDEIVLALLERPMDDLEAVLAEAEAVVSRERQLDTLLEGLVDIVLENPEAVAMLQADPAVARLVQTRQSYRDVVGRLDAVLAGPRPGPTARLAGVLFGAGLLTIGHHPLLADIDAETVRHELPRIGRRILP